MSLRAEARSPRGLALSTVAGVLLLQAAFIASYVGGLHGPSAHKVPVAVVASRSEVGQLTARLGSAADKVRLFSVPTVAAARHSIVDRDAYGAFAPQPAGGRLIVASARGKATTQLLRSVFAPLAQSGGGSLRVTDMAPLSSSDPDGLTVFYLVIGWIVGAYLVSAIIGLYRGMTPAGPKDAAVRLAVLGGYAVLSGAIGMAIVQPGYGYISGSRVAMFGIGSLLVFSVAAATTALEAATGIIGTGIAILLFVVLGNPSAGGPWPSPLVAWPWRLIGPWLPNGAATTATTQAVYFDVQAVTVPMLVLAGYAAAGIVGTLALSRRGRPWVDVPGH